MKADRLVEAIQDAARKHDGLAMLGGLVGDGAKSGLVRLYLRPELDWYVEFPEKAVVHRLELPAEASFLGGSLLWVVPGTKLTDVKSSPLAEQASFLRGSLIESQLLKGELSHGRGCSGSHYWLMRRRHRHRNGDHRRDHLCQLPLLHDRHEWDCAQLGPAKPAMRHHERDGDLSSADGSNSSAWLVGYEAPPRYVTMFGNAALTRGRP